MNDFRDPCVVCGEPSAALICSECNRLIATTPPSSTPTKDAASDSRSAAVDSEAPGDDATMGGWWDELDDEIMNILGAGGPMETTRLAAKLGMSPEAVGSCLAMLSTSGRVWIRSVELPPGAINMRAA